MCRVHFTFAFAPLIELSRFVPRMIFAQFRGTLQRASRKCNFIDSPFSLADLPTQLTFQPSSRYVALVSNHGPTSACAHNSFDEGEQARNLPKNIQILAQFSRSSPHYYFRDKSLCSERALMMGAHGIGAWKEARSAIFDGAKRVPSNTNRRFDGWWLSIMLSAVFFISHFSLCLVRSFCLWCDGFRQLPRRSECFFDCGAFRLTQQSSVLNTLD